MTHFFEHSLIESSVINAKHELSIDPELRLQALSPSFPTPPPTPVPNRHLNSDEESAPRSTLSHSQVDFPRQGSGTGTELLKVLHNQLNVAVAGPSARMSSIVVNPGISGPSSQSLSAAQNVSAAWSQSTSGNQWQSLPKPGPRGLSWKGTNESGSAWTSAWSSLPPPPPLIPISSVLRTCLKSRRDEVK